MDWAAFLAEPKAKRQGYWGKRSSAAKRARLLRTLDEDGQLALRGGGGPGAGAWLLPREEGDELLPDAHFLANLRMRFSCDVCAPGARCQHRKADGSLCGEPLDAKGWHARKCGCGGSRDYRHNSLRDWSAPWHCAQTGHRATTEQRVPAWDRQNPDTGAWEEAVLDVATRDPVTNALVYLDWSVTCEHSNNDARRQARARTDGVAAAQAVDRKRARYPPAGGELIPAVLESGGRPADELVAFVRSYGWDLPDADRSAVISATWRKIQRCLAFGNAEMLLSAT